MKKIKNISDETLNKIIKNKIKPIPKWEFMAKNLGLWMGLVVSVLILIVGLGLSWFGLMDNLITPYLWVAVAFIFLWVSYFIFENTKKAYRISKLLALTLILGLGLIAGIAVYKIGLANKIDVSFEKNLPYYRIMAPMKMQNWMNPTKGYLAGEISKIISTNELELIDFNNKSWIIKIDGTLVRGRVEIATGSIIKIIGKMQGDEFVASEIRPWMGMMQN